MYSSRSSGRSAFRMIMRDSLVHLRFTTRSLHSGQVYDLRLRYPHAGAIHWTARLPIVRCKARISRDARVGSRVTPIRADGRGVACASNAARDGATVVGVFLVVS